MTDILYLEKCNTKMTIKIETAYGATSGPWATPIRPNPRVMSKETAMKGEHRSRPVLFYNLGSSHIPNAMLPNNESRHTARVNYRKRSIEDRGVSLEGS